MEGIPILYVLGFSGEREPTEEWETEKEKEIYFKELASVITKAAKSKLCRVGQHTGDPGKSQYCSSNPKAIYQQNSLLLGRGQPLF